MMLKEWMHPNYALARASEDAELLAVCRDRSSSAPRLAPLSVTFGNLDANEEEFQADHNLEANDEEVQADHSLEANEEEVQAHHNLVCVREEEVQADRDAIVQVTC